MQIFFMSHEVPPKKTLSATFSVPDSQLISYFSPTPSLFFKTYFFFPYPQATWPSLGMEIPNMIILTKNVNIQIPHMCKVKQVTSLDKWDVQNDEG